MQDSNSYATDGRCHNSEPGTFNHECGKPATWIGIRRRDNFRMGFCDGCKERGYEAKSFQTWVRPPVVPVSAPNPFRPVV
jgi:hypothetical protein